MPRISREDAPRRSDHGIVEDLAGELEGYTVNFVTFRQDFDTAPLLKGLPDDRCQCAHWGYVVKGRLTYRIGDREEVYEAGDAFYHPPGHVPLGHEPGTEIVQFSPTQELRETEAAITRNLETMQVG